MSTPVHGFKLLKTQPIPELKSVGKLYLHVKTRAQLISIENDDENKSFGITFRTPPPDSSGVAHIMEHSVLCGSHKYPVKEPFVELIKGSLNTFLNALTYPDKTSYPVASINLADFYNLVDVYLDAVFFPRITREIFEQEGWHYELDDKKNPLKYKGVVFNEMKGSYSSPDRVLYETIQQSLLPDTIYAYDSGGHPREIPKLTYEDFSRFHTTYYHPSNAYLFFAGNDDPLKRLEIANAYLSQFQHQVIDSHIAIQKPIKKQPTITRSYSVSENEDVHKKTMVTVNWLFPEVNDIETTLALEILEYILLGTSSAPLQRALIESGIGEDTAGFGLETEIQQYMFSTGLKGIQEKDVEKVHELVVSTLHRLATDGFDPKDITAALNTIEFHLREQNTGSFPRGLSMMFSSLSHWLYGKDPFAPLLFEKPLLKLKQEIKRNPHYFESLVKQYILDNPHTTMVVLRPDPLLAQRLEQEERDELRAYQETLSDEDLDAVVAHSKALKLAQETPDKPEDLAKLPRLLKSDLDPKITLYPKEVQDDKHTWILHDLFTNGIVYLDIGFNAKSLPTSLLPYLPLFTRSLLEMGNATHTYIELSQHIHTKTGGINGSIVPFNVFGSKNAALYVFLRAKCLSAQVDDMASLLEEIILSADFANKDRFLQMLLEEKAGMEASLVENGHRVVKQRIASQYNQADYISEQFSGISQLQFVRSLIVDFDQKWSEISHTLKTMATLLFTQDNTILNLTCERSQFKLVQHPMTTLVSQLSNRKYPKEVWPVSSGVRNEILIVPTTVNYVGKGTNLYRDESAYHGSYSVVARYIRSTWLWEQVRVKGGAYGGFTSFDWISGVFAFLSYRDPRLAETVKTFDSTTSYLENTTMSDDEVTKAIIGAISDIDQYLLPDSKGWTSLIQHLSQLPDTYRQQKRTEVLHTTAKDFTRFAKQTELVAKHGTISVMTNKEQAEKVKDLYADTVLTTVL